MVTVGRAALCLCLWLFTSEVRGHYVPQEMNRTIQNLLQHYKISSGEKLFNGRPIFSRELRGENPEVQRVFMGGVLNTYETLLSLMLSRLPTAEPPTGPSAPVPTAMATGEQVGCKKVESKGAEPEEEVRRKELNYILCKVKELKRERYKKEEKLLVKLHGLRQLQLQSAVVQNKALRELLGLFEEASALTDDNAARRRRRGTKIKSPPRG